MLERGAMVGGGVVRQKEQAKGKDKQRESDRRRGVEGTESQRATNGHLLMLVDEPASNTVSHQLSSSHHGG